MTEHDKRPEPIDIIEQRYGDGNGLVVESTDSAEFQEQQKELGTYLADAARWEIGRTTGIGTAVLSAISLIGAGASILATSLVKLQGGLSLVAAGSFAASANLMIVALVVILVTLKPVPTRYSKNKTGWPVLTNPNRGELIREFRRSAKYLPVFLRDDAVTLARIANRKHARLRVAAWFVLAGAVVFCLGVDVQLLALFLA